MVQEAAAPAPGPAVFALGSAQTRPPVKAATRRDALDSYRPLARFAGVKVGCVTEGNALCGSWNGLKPVQAHVKLERSFRRLRVCSGGQAVELDRWQLIRRMPPARAGSGNGSAQEER